jgi:hypothetical protein
MVFRYIFNHPHVGHAAFRKPKFEASFCLGLDFLRDW